MANHEAPQSRNEAILQNILGEENVLQEPQSRIEELLTEILEHGIVAPIITTSGETMVIK